MPIFPAIASVEQRIGNFGIPASLSGVGHTFPFEGKIVTVTLPSFQLDSECKVTHPDDDSIYRYTWKPAEGLPSARYCVSRLLVEVEVTEALDAPEGLFERNINAFDLFDSAGADANTKLLVKYTNIASAAVQYWLRVARWVTGAWLLGIEGAESESGYPDVEHAHFLNADTKKPFWGLGGHIALRRRAELLDTHWATMQAALLAEAQPPSWMAFLNEAADRMNRKDFAGALTSCAIAIETSARAVYHAAAGSPTNDAVVDLMQRAGASAVVDQWKVLTGSTDKAPGASVVLKLLQVRNKLLHLGQTEQITAEKMEKYVEGVQEFVRAADAWYHTEAKLTNFAPVAGA